MDEPYPRPRVRYEGNPVDAFNNLMVGTFCFVHVFDPLEALRHQFKCDRCGVIFTVLGGMVDWKESESSPGKLQFGEKQIVPVGIGCTFIDWSGIDRELVCDPTSPLTGAMI